jgi:ATP-binding cassette subfamily B protein
MTYPKNNFPKKSLLWFIWYFAKQRLLSITLLFIAALAWALDLSFRSYMIKLLLDRVSAHESIYALIAPATLYLCSGLALNASFRFYDLVRLKTIPSLQADIIRCMNEYVEQHSYHFFQSHLSGALANQIQEMATGVREIIKITIDRFFSNIIALTIAAITLATISQTLALIMIAWSIIFFIMTYFFSQQSDGYAQRLSQAQNITMGAIIDSLSNILTVKLFARNTYESHRIQEKLAAQVQRDQDLEWCTLKIRALQGLSVTGLIGCLLAYLLYARMYNVVTVGDFALTISIALALSESILNLSDDFITFSESVGRCKQALKLVQIGHSIVDHPSTQELVVGKGDICFKNVSFIHDAQITLFNDLSITIPGGQQVGLVGFSGAGKSTFVHLITRLFEPQKGSIFIDGHNIAQVTQDSLRHKISFIPQETNLFHRSIKDNILYGLPDASEENIEQAARNAHAHDFIQSLPEGYNALVGERGVKLSGGQRQRIALARAFLKNAPILILDEATAALDSETEQHIQKSLDLLMHNKTVIIIAHRLSTLMRLDRILVFDNGSIVQDGNHALLKNVPGVYSRLWKAQIDGFLPDLATNTTTQNQKIEHAHKSL